MRASQELRWKQRIRENEERRRRYEETSKRLELEEKEKAQQALEQRRAERARMDDLMRHPSQAPAPPKKPILRKGSGAVLRSPVKAAAGTCCSPRPATMPLQGTTAALGPRSPARAAAAGAGSNQQSCMVDRQHREWADSLKQFIAGQREASKPKQDTCLPADDGLSWQELKVAAEAGFEELLKTQEAAAMAAAAAGQQHTPAWRRPGMTRATGGGGSTAEQWAGAAGLEWTPLGTPAQLPYASTPPSMAPHPAGSSSSSSPPVSKWAARMQQARGAAEAACSSAQDPGCSNDLQSPGIDSSIARAAPAGPTVQLEEQQGMHAACQPETHDGMQDANEPGQPAACSANQLDAQQQLLQQTDLLQAEQQNGQHVHHSQLQDTTAPAQQLQPACGGQQGSGTSGAASCALSPAGHSSTACSSPGPEVAAVGALPVEYDEAQHLTAAAAQAAAALKASMDQLHRSTEQAGRSCDLAASAPANTAPTAAASQHEASGSSSRCSSRCSDHEHSTCCADDTSPTAPRALCAEPDPAYAPLLQPAAAGAAASALCAAVAAADEHCLLMVETEQAAVAPPQHDQAGLQEEYDGTAVVRPVAQAAAVPKCSLAQLQLQLQRHRQEQELELESVISEGTGGSLGQDHAVICQTDPAACSTLPMPQDELPASGLSAAGSQQGSCTEAAHGCVAAGAAHAHGAVAADVRHIQDHNTSVDHQQQDMQQEALMQQQQQLRGTEDHLMRPFRHEDATNLHCSRQHALVAGGSHAPNRQSAQATPSMSEVVHDLHPAPDGSAAPAASAGPSTTLDSLLAEAKQLAALRRAVGAEFAAMGRNRVAAVMGAVGPLTGSSGTTGTTGHGSGSSCGDGSNTEMGCSARCDDTAGQWQPPHPAQQHDTQQPLVTPLQAVPGSSSAWPADSPHRAATGDGRALQDTAQHTVPPQGPSLCAVGPGQHAHTTEGPVQCLLQHQHQQRQTHQQQQQEQLMEQQQEEEEVEPQNPWPHYEPAQLPQQQQRQQYTPAVHTQQRAVASSRGTVPLTAASGVDLNRPAAQLCLTSNPLYQSSPQSPSSVSCISLPSHDQQLHLGGQGGAHTARCQQKQLQQQHEQSNQLQLQQQKLEEEIVRLSVDSQPQLQRGHAQQMHHASHQPIPTQTATGLRLHSKPAAVTCPIQQQDSPHCHWQAGSSSQHDAAAVTGAHQLQAPVVAGDTVPQQASLSSGHVFDTAAASQGQLPWSGPPVSCQIAQHQWMYPGPSSSCAPMASTAAATAPRAEPHALSRPHKAEAMSAGAAPWLVQLPPLCDAGPAGANWTGPVSPSTAAAAGCSRACDGSPERGSSRSSSPQSSHFLSKLASKARSAVFSAVGRFNGSVQHQHLHPTQQQMQMQQQQQQQQVAAVQAQLPGAAPKSCNIQAEDQGSYVAAALVAQQRAQVDAAERERMRAAAEAAKQTAAKRLAAERAEAQRRAAEQAAQHKQPPPVAIGSYARQQPSQQHVQASTQHQAQQQAQRSQEQCQADFMTQDVDQQLDGYGQENAPAGQHALGRTAAVPPPVLKKASGTREQQQAADGQGKQPVLPQDPAPYRNSSPRRRAVRQRTTTSPALMAAAAGPPAPKAAAVRCMEPVGVDVPTVLARAVDQHAPVSRIPAAPGSKPSTPGYSGAAGSSSPSHHGAASRGSGAGRQLQQQAAAASMGACQASRVVDSEDDDDFAYLERELQEDAMAACQPARPDRLELQQGQTGQGYWSQQQQVQPQQLQHGKVQQQQQGPQQPAHSSYQQTVMSQPAEHHKRADPAGAGEPYPGKGPSSMWAAVHAATGSQAWAGTAADQYSSWSGDPQHPGSHTAQQPQQLSAAAAELRRAPGTQAAATARPAGPATRHGIRGTAGAAATQVASASILAAPGGHVPTGAYRATAAAAAAAPAQQQLQHQARVALPQPQHGASSIAPQPSQAPVKPGRKPPQQQQQQQQQQSSRLSLEEAALLAELQQLDQRIHQPSHLQQTDAPARSAKLPVLAAAAAAAGGGASQPRTRAATARGAAASKSPARQAPTTAPEQRAAAGCNGMKLAAVRGATGSRGSSSSSSGARSDPTAGRLPQQQSRAGKQARLVALPNTVGAAAKAGGAPSPKRPPVGAVTAGVAAGPAGASGPMPSSAVLPPWVMPGMMGQGAAVPGVFPGGCGPQGYWWAPGGQCGYTNPGVAWPEGPAAAGGVGGPSWPSEAAYRAPGQPPNRGEHMGVMMEPRGPAVPAWLGQQPAHGPVPWQQQVWWQGQLQPQGLSHAGHLHGQQLHAGMPYSPGGISQGHGQGGFPCPYPSARSGTPQPHSNHYHGSGPYSMQGPPLTAPSGMREVPGSPLLPTLHYQQTVMRDRTSSRGGAETGSGGESWQVAYAGQAVNSAGSASGPGSRWGSAGSGSSNGGSARPQQEGVVGAASSWGCRVAQEAADVWPARGLERSVLSGIQAKGGVGRRQDEDGPGEIVVYNAHLLLS